MIDIDDFKNLNETFGHDYGDLVLKRLASIFQAQFNDDNYFIRMGGDEFAVLYAGKGPEAIIRHCADELANDKQLTESEGSQPVLISSGVVIVDTFDQVKLDDIYRQADSALYQAKNRDTHEKLQSAVMTTRLGE